MSDCPEAKWLLLIHQIPPKPGYFRVKIWRRLQGLGAVAIKNTVYVIPRNEETLEDFQWVLREILQGGGEASICAATFIEGLTDDEVEALFRVARNADYAQISEEARAMLDTAPSTPAAATVADRNELGTSVTRLRKRLSSVKRMDFFNASGGEAAETLVDRIENLLGQVRNALVAGGEDRKPDLAQLRGRTWVTRKGAYVDRIASAWLIRRFIDPGAQFKFVLSKGYKPKTGELRFDMFEGEFTHTGDLCTFEALVQRFFSLDGALVRIGQIVHDLDLKDGKFSSPEAPGIGAMIEGLTSAHKSDEARLERGRDIFDDLYEYFRRK